MNHAVKAQPVRWTPQTIREEVARRSLTLRGVALAAGLPEAACRQALHGINRKGADALADALGIPFDTLFPEGFVQSRRQASVNRLVESRKKNVPAADTAGVR